MYTCTGHINAWELPSNFATPFSHKGHSNFNPPLSPTGHTDTFLSTSSEIHHKPNTHQLCMYVHQTHLICVCTPPPQYTDPPPHSTDPSLHSTDPPPHSTDPPPHSTDPSLHSTDPPPHSTDPPLTLLTHLFTSSLTFRDFGITSISVPVHTNGLGTFSSCTTNLLESRRFPRVVAQCSGCYDNQIMTNKKGKPRASKWCPVVYASTELKPQAL